MASVTVKRSRLIAQPTTPLVLSLFLLSEAFASPQDQSKSAVEQKPVASEAPSEEAQAEALQKAVQNPVASLISVPLQNNANFSYGPYNRTQDVLNIQP